MNSDRLHRYRMVVAYDGTAYCGWQLQPGNVTIQGCLESALAKVTGAPGRVIVHGSGRTDQGVHAQGQVAHFDLARVPAAGSAGLMKSLNAVLPGDIRVLQLKAAPGDFHARKDAIAKEYRYFIWDGPVLPPAIRLYRAHEPGGLDVVAMRHAAARLVGKHDFAAFTANPNREVETTVRNLATLDVRRKGHEIAIIASADGFLYKMVRSIAGLLMRVGSGQVLPAQVGGVLTSRVRTALVPTADPQGLFLWKVEYA